MSVATEIRPFLIGLAPLLAMGGAAAYVSEAPLLAAMLDSLLVAVMFDHLVYGTRWSRLSKPAGLAGTALASLAAFGFAMGLIPA